MRSDFLMPGTDLRVSPIALGTTKAGIAWQGAAADRIFDRYLDLGGNIIDTARIYTPPTSGASESAIGQWLRRSGKRQQVILVTKGGHPDIHTMHEGRMAYDDMAADLDASLVALGTDVIDLYFYHRDDENRPVAELLETMERLHQAGKIRWYGCSNWRAGRIREANAYARAHGLAGFVANQCEYNVGTYHMGPMRDDTMVAAGQEMLRLHADGQLTLMAYCSMCGGFFHKLLSQGEEAVSTKRYFTPGNLQAAQCLKALQEAYHASISQVELGFLLTRPFPVVALAGVSCEAQLEDLMKATDIPFREKDYSFAVEKDTIDMRKTLDEEKMRRNGTQNVSFH